MHYNLQVKFVNCGDDLVAAFRHVTMGSEFVSNIEKSKDGNIL